jgi:hypothetical protein
MKSNKKLKQIRPTFDWTELKVDGISLDMKWEPISESVKYTVICMDF